MECGREIHISPKRHKDFIRKGNHLPRVCRDCSDKLLDRYLCRQCGERIYRSANQIIEITRSGKQPFIYCKDCSDELLDKYLCHRCNKRIYRNVNQVVEIMKYGKEPNVYCRDCGNMPAGEIYYCRDCGHPFRLTLQEEYNFQKRMRENPSWNRPKRCRACREKKRQAMRR